MRDENISSGRVERVPNERAAGGEEAWVFVDLDKLLEPVEGEDEPTGPDLEYGDAFTELERSARGRPERQIGDVVQPAVPPEWPPILSSAVALFARSKDLRVALTLCRALIGIHGPAGLADGLEVVQALIERWWDGVHPRLDPEDDNDPTMRVNVIAGLADNDAVLRLLRESVVVASRATGRFTLKQVLAAHASAEAPESEAALIEAAFRDCPIEELRERVDSLKRARTALQAIERTLVDNVGSGNAPDLSALTDLLREATAVLAPKLEAREGPSTGVAEAAGEASADVPAESGVALGPGVPRPGVIAGRADVAAAIDAICAYYAANEPSSPVPLILARAKRLINMNFLELLRDLTPEGVSRFTTISGQGEES